jgi:hypothetical protein
MITRADRCYVHSRQSAGWATTRSSNNIYQLTNSLEQVSLDKLVVKSLTESGGRRLDGNTSGLKSRDLGAGTTLTTGDDGSSVAHSSSGRSRHTGNEGADGLGDLSGLVVLLEEVSGLLLGGTSNLTDHDDTVGVLVLEENLEAVDEVGTGKGVTSDTDNERLAETDLGGLVDGLVSKGSGSGHNTDSASLVDGRGHDTDLALAGSNDTGAVGTDKSGLGLGLEHVDHSDHVVLGDTLSDTDNEGQLGLNGLLDRGGGKRRGDEDGGGVTSSLLHGLGNGAEDGETEMALAGLLGVGSSNDLGAVVDGLLGVEGSLLSGEALEEHLGVGVDLQVVDGISVASDGGRSGEGSVLVGGRRWSILQLNCWSHSYGVVCFVAMSSLCPACTGLFRNINNHMQPRLIYLQTALLRGRLATVHSTRGAVMAIAPLAVEVWRRCPTRAVVSVIFRPLKVTSNSGINSA